jgi:Icc-related predicted phosphoesterase
MKIAVTSDVHLEFGQLKLTNDEEARVLILSGDICVAADLMIWDEQKKDLGFTFAKSDRYHEFFQNCCEQFQDVIYIAGNHEHYHGDFPQTHKILNNTLKYLPNLHILDKQSVTIDDVTFIGSTLWTDMNRNDPLTLYQIRRMMNDFRIIKNSDRVVSYKSVDEDGKSHFHERQAAFSPEDAVDEHVKCLAYIQECYDNTEGDIVVVGHHTPSLESCHPIYRNDKEMNGGYHSDLSEFILARPRIKLWTHGHTHEDFDYMIGETRVVCNPRGYIGHEHRADNFALKYVEV